MIGHSAEHVKSRKGLLCDGARAEAIEKITEIAS